MKAIWLVHVAFWNLRGSHLTAETAYSYRPRALMPSAQPRHASCRRRACEFRGYIDMSRGSVGLEKEVPDIRHHTMESWVRICTCSLAMMTRMSVVDRAALMAEQERT